MNADTELGSLALRHRVLLLVLIGLLLYVPFLGLRDLWYPDEPDIGEVCQAMYESGDWVAPRRMGVIWVDYPPMLYWAGAASAHVLGGMSEFALRLPNALAAVRLGNAEVEDFGARQLHRGFLRRVQQRLPHAAQGLERYDFRQQPECRFGRRAGQRKISVGSTSIDRAANETKQRGPSRCRDQKSRAGAH